MDTLLLPYSEQGVSVKRMSDGAGPCSARFSFDSFSPGWRCGDGGRVKGEGKDAQAPVYIQTHKGYTTVLWQDGAVGYGPISDL